MQLEVIKDLCGNYLKIHKGRATKTTEVTKASKFNTGAAQEYIDHQIKKSERDSYYIETVSMNNVRSKSNSINQSGERRHELNCVKIVTDINIELHKNLRDLYEQLCKELQKCDDDIMDYRHYMRSPDTVLNAVQLCKAAQLCQTLERKRVSVKKELERCEMILQIGDNLQNQAEQFDYKPYNPRGKINFNLVIKGVSQ